MYNDRFLSDSQPIVADHGRTHEAVHFILAECPGRRQYLSDEFALLYVASGGSEGYFLEIFDRLKNRNCYILTSGESNSLAASMEILSYLRKHGGSGEILHGDIEQIIRQIRILRNAHRGLNTLRGKKLGCIGKPSDWLIASDYVPDAVMKRLGLGFVSIPMEELQTEIAEKCYTENEYTELFKQQRFDAGEVEKALYVYGAFQRIVDKYNLCGVSVRCFDTGYCAYDGLPGPVYSEQPGRLRRLRRRYAHAAFYGDPGLLNR